MLNRIANLKVEGCGLIFSDPSVVSVIVLAASSMLVNSKQAKKVKEKTFEGMMFTNFERGFIGGLGGVIFDISLESDYGSTSMKFVLVQPMTEDEIKNCVFFICPEEEFDVLNEFLKQSVGDASSAVQ